MSGISYPVNLGLGDAPDPDLRPEVWQELNKLQLACKFLAGALGAGSTGSNGDKLVGSFGAGVTVQDYCRIRYIPSVNIPAGSILELGQTTLQLTSTSYPYPGAYAEEYVAAGSVGEFTLFGMVHYLPGGLVPGTKYYTNLTVPGGITTVATGNKFVGQAFGVDVLYFDPLRS